MQSALHPFYILKSAVIITVLLLMSGFSASATHMVGSDISYKCTTTPGIFEITLVVYRDCSGIPLCGGGCGTGCSKFIRVFYGTTATNIYTEFISGAELSLQNVRDVNINPLCASSKSICDNNSCIAPGTYTPGVERYEFKGFINIGAASGIPANACFVRIAFEEQARNSIENASIGDFYIEALINRCQSVPLAGYPGSCNSSPELTNDPYAVVCGGESFVFNNGAFDPDHDSLSFAFVPALVSHDQSVTYLSPFTYDKPMPWTGNSTAPFPDGIHCDPLSGDITFTPGNASNQTFIGIVAMEVKQWKIINGVVTLMGITRRDVQILLLANCPPNNIPTLLTNPPDPVSPTRPKYNWEVCAGEQLCFGIKAKDVDVVPISDTTYLDWNKTLAAYGATFKPNYDITKRRKPAPEGGPREDDYQFCWTPDSTKASSLPYYFTITGKDNRCPNPGKITRAFSIRVLGKADAAIKKDDLKCGKWQLSYIKNKPSQIFNNVVWNVSKVPNDYSLSNVYTYQNVQSLPVLTFTQGGRYLVELNIQTAGPIGGSFCTRTIYDTLRVDTLVDPIVKDTFNCRGSSILISATARYGTPGYLYYWFNSIKDTLLTPLNAPVYSSGGLTVNPTSTRYYTIKVRDFSGCINYDSLKVSVRDLPVGTLPDSMRLCYGDTFKLDPGNNGGNIRSYLWNEGDTTRTILRMDSGRYTVVLTDTSNCSKTDTLLLYKNRQIIANAGMDTSICKGDTMILRGSGGQLYQWRDLSGNTTISAKSHLSRVTVTPQNTNTPVRYEVKVFESYPDTVSHYKECSVTDTVEVTVRPLPQLTRPALTQICRSTKEITMSTFGNNQGGGTDQWSYPRAPGSVTGAQVKIDSLKNVPSRDTTGSFDNWIRYKYTAPVVPYGGCTSYDSAQVRVYGTPKVDAGPKLLWCVNGGVFTINTGQGYSPNPGNGANQEWTGPGVTTQTVGGSKIFRFTPTAAGVKLLPDINIVNYKYTQVYNQGVFGLEISCDNQDTVIFTVTNPPTVDGGNDLLICRNEPAFNIAAKAQSTSIPPTGKSFWVPATASIRGAMSDSLVFNASHSSIVIPTSGPVVDRVSYKLYYIDNSTGCEVRDSINVTVGRVPDTHLYYDDPVSDSPFVCRNTDLVYFHSYVGSSEIKGVYSGSSSFTENPNLGANISRALFNSATAAAGKHTLVFTYTVTYSVSGKTTQCSGSDSSYIQVQEPPVLEVSTPAPICSYDAEAMVSLVRDPAPYGFRWVPTGDGSYDKDTAYPALYTAGVNDKASGQVVIQAESRLLALSGNGDPCPVVTDSKTLQIIQAPQSTVICDSCEGCVPFTASISAGPTGVADAHYSWQWLNEPGLSSTDSSVMRSILTYQGDGKYYVMLTTSTNTTPSCSTSSIWTPVLSHAVPKARFEADPPFTTIAKPFFNFINQSSVADNSGMGYLWNLGPGPGYHGAGTKDRLVTDANPANIEYEADTAAREVKLYVTTEYGCIDSTMRKIRIDPDITVFIPNAFRPGSGVPCTDGDVDCNRVFKVSANGYLSIELYVFNRWGQQVYYGNDASQGWDGSYKGEACQQDVYVYQVNAISFSGKQYKYSGSVTLLK